MAPEVKTAKNSKLPKLSENCFEPVGKGGWPPISTWIISFDNKDDTTSLKLKVVVLLPMDTTKLYHEFGKYHIKPIHLFSSEILISIDNS
jgi:hypothetical protein